MVVLVLVLVVRCHGRCGPVGRVILVKGGIFISPARNGIRYAAEEASMSKAIRFPRRVSLNAHLPTPRTRWSRHGEWR